MHIVLYQPEIAPNTGSIMRLCANAGACLHLIAPLGFSLEDRRLRRAGLDYREWVTVATHASLAAYWAVTQSPRTLALSTRARRCYAEITYREDDTLLFGAETRGLPLSVLAALPAEQCVRIPMRPHSRSVNLANAVAIVLFEAWRQRNFDGAATPFASDVPEEIL